MDDDATGMLRQIRDLMQEQNRITAQIARVNDEMAARSIEMQAKSEAVAGESIALARATQRDARRWMVLLFVTIVAMLGWWLFG